VIDVRSTYVMFMLSTAGTAAEQRHHQSV